MPEGLEPQLQAGSYPVADPLALAIAFDQAGLAQNSQMVGHVRLLLADLLDQIAYALLAYEQGLQDRSRVSSAKARKTLAHSRSVRSALSAISSSCRARRRALRRRQPRRAN